MLIIFKYHEFLSYSNPSFQWYESFTFDCNYNVDNKFYNEDKKFVLRSQCGLIRSSNFDCNYNFGTEFFYPLLLHIPSYSVIAYNFYRFQLPLSARQPNPQDIGSAQYACNVVHMVCRMNLQTKENCAQNNLPEPKTVIQLIQESILRHRCCHFIFHSLSSISPN